MAEMPDGIAIETIWVVEASYTPEAQERRPAVRHEHLTRLAELRARGILLEAGAFQDWSGSMLLLRVPDEETALSIAAEDAYARAGVWASYRARALGRVVRAEELG